MRGLTVIVGASLGLAACGDQAADQNTVDNSAAVATEAIVSNDTTTIDAATGDAANMAADVDYTVNSSSDSTDAGTDRSVNRPTSSRRPDDTDEPSNESDDPPLE